MKKVSTVSLRVSGKAMLLGAAIGLLSCAGAAEQVTSWPDTSLARIEVLALTQSLNAELLGSKSATSVLDKWCADHALSSDGKIHARLLKGEDLAPSAEQRARLHVGENEPIKYRHVELACGSHVFSIAHNWYVPARLTPEMNQLLETTDTPFGRVVGALKPFRQTFMVKILWRPLPEGWENKALPTDQSQAPLEIPHDLFEHRAVLYTADNQPFSEVDEIYTKHVLDFGPPK